MGNAENFDISIVYFKFIENAPYETAPPLQFIASLTPIRDRMPGSVRPRIEHAWTISADPRAQIFLFLALCNISFCFWHSADVNRL